METVNFDMNKCLAVTKNFAEKLRNCGEIKAAQAVESVIKFLPTYIVKE